MKDITHLIPRVFRPRTGWERDLIGVADPDGSRMRGEMVPDIRKELPEGSVVISGSFEAWQECWAVRGGRVVARAHAAACTCWDDPDTTRILLPDDGEKLFVIGDSVTAERQRRDYARPGDEERFQAGLLLAAGAWKDAADMDAAASKAAKAAKKAAYQAVVRECNRLYGRFADKLLSAHLGGGWSLEASVAEAAIELTYAPEYVKSRKDKGVPAGRSSLRLLEDFRKPVGPDILRDALGGLSGPRMDRAFQIAEIILGI